MKPQSFNEQKSIIVFIRLLSLVGLLCAYPFWHKPLGDMLKHRLFFEPDAILLLAGTLFISSLVFISPFFDRLSGKIFHFLKSKRLQSKLFIGVVLVGVFIFLLWINKAVFHHFLNSADEHSCYFLAESLRLGKWWVKPHELSDFFNVVHVGNKEGKWFSVYPPGWPVIWAVGLNFQIQNYLNPIMSILILTLFYKFARDLYGRGTATATLIFTSFTAFFLFTGASYYSHTTCLLAMMVFIHAYFKWIKAVDEASRVRWTIVIGLAVGYGLLTRYLTMAAFCAPFLLYRVTPLIFKKRKLRKSDIVFFALIGLAFFFIFWQNYAVTGDFHKAPNRFDKSWERLGFKGDYSVAEGLIYFLTRFFYLSDWVSPFLIFAFVFFTVKGKYETLDERLLHYSFYFPAIAYFFYFSWGGNQYGPRYLYEGWPFMVLAVMVQVKRLDDRHEARWRNFFILGLVLSLFTGGYQIAKQSIHYEIVSRERKALYALAEKEITEKDAIVFINGFLGDALVMSQEDAVRNAPLLNTRILYAHDRGPENFKLMQYYPDRHYFRGSFDRIKKTATLEKLFS